MRIALWGAVVGVAGMIVAANAGWIGVPSGAFPPPRVIESAALPIGGEFDLIDHEGNRRSWSDFRGKPAAVFFGFTHCPDICPMTLGELSLLLADLGERGDELQVLLISGDPGRDTPQVLARYLESFDPRIVALTGEEEQIDEAFELFRAYREIVPLDGGGYTVDHSAGVYLYDSNGGFVGTLDRDEPSDIRLQKVERLLDGAKGVSGS